jgi:hypothetical protein
LISGGVDHNLWPRILITGARARACFQLRHFLPGPCSVVKSNSQNQKHRHTSRECTVGQAGDRSSLMQDRGQKRSQGMLLLVAFRRGQLTRTPDGLRLPYPRACLIPSGLVGSAKVKLK